MSPLALFIDTRASPSLTIKHKNQNNNLFAIYPAFQQYVAGILAPPCEHFTPPSL